MTQTVQPLDSLEAGLTPYLDLIRRFREDREPAILVEVSNDSDTSLTAYEQLRPVNQDSIESDGTSVALYPLELLIDVQASMPIVIIAVDLIEADSQSASITDRLSEDPVTVLYLHDGEILDVVLGAAGEDGMLAGALTFRFSDDERALILGAVYFYVECDGVILAAWANSHAALLP